MPHKNMGLKTKANGPRDSTADHCLDDRHVFLLLCEDTDRSTLTSEPSPRDFTVGGKQQADLASDFFIFNRVLLPVRRLFLGSRIFKNSCAYSNYSSPTALERT